jgi:hypothetical protein
MIKRILFTLFIIAFTLSACGGKATPDPALDPVLAMTQAFATVNAAFTQTALAVPTNTLAPTETPIPTAPSPVEFIPTAIIQVTVAVPAVNCRFGPDIVYVAPYGLRSGKVREAIGRDTTGNWLLVREMGGKKACWVSALAVTMQGDPANLAIAPVQLSFTNKYAPPLNTMTARNNNQVQVTWSEVPLEARDIYPESRYLLEVWVCSSGQLTHTLIGTNDLSAIISDETGCAETSHAQIYTATKSGYSNPAEIPWPPR